MRICHACGKEVRLKGDLGREDLCLHCRADLHCCLNCSLYDEYAQNKCREPAAEWVNDRAKSNFCEYFLFKQSAGGRGRKEKEEALAKLEALFKKKNN